MRNAYTYRKIGMQKNIQTKIEENLLDKMARTVKGILWILMWINIIYIFKNSGQKTENRALNENMVNVTMIKIL